MKRLLIAIVLIAAAAAAALFVLRRAPGSGGMATGGPIILISIDTLRADRLPAYGYTAIKTPAIDRFAADSVLFERAWSHSPQTLPAHTSILTGRLPFEHGVRDNIGFTVKDGEPMLQQALRDRGYATGGFVSSYVLRKQIGLAQGFNVYDDQMPAAAGDRTLGQMQRNGSETLAATERWLDTLTSPKFFLFFHIYEPHTPYTPSYDTDVEAADRIVGRLLDGLRSRGLYDEATIVLLSDHGEGLGDHGEEEHGTFLYSTTMHVPLIVKAPGGAGAGRKVAAAVQHLDVAPTLLTAGGIEPAGFKGRALQPAMAATGSLADASIYSEAMSARYHFGWSELYALTDERYRYIRAPRDELFDLSQDPGEMTSIAGERPQVRAAMRGALDALIANAPVSAPTEVSSEDRQKLAALGYVGTQTRTPMATAGDSLADPKDKLGVLQQYRRATRLAGEGRVAEATEAYRALLREDPEMTDVWLQLATLYEKRGMFQGAFDAYREIISRNPKDPAALTGAAGALVQLGRLDEARAHGELAVPVAPVHAHELLARLAVQRGEEDAARRHARLAAEADPGLPMPAFVEGLIRHHRGEFAAAIPPLQEVAAALAQRTGQIADAHFLLGDALARTERYAEAERALKAELAVSPAHARARVGLAMLYASTGRPREAEAAIEELVRRVPSDEGYRLAAQLWTMFGRPERAAELRARGRR
ncbi:MAG: sulfatase-like hydrolase/transferase [Acidobacteriota bacterium]|nr:sulfatase-like hydrolase/transferase [Acidobacteriota bacterium]